MLFDLRGRGRRRTVQGIYLMLAILMGGGLVLFGVGGATSGGLVDAITGNKSNSGTSSSTYEKRIETAQKATAAQPKSTTAWADLARNEYLLAGTGDNFDQDTSTYTNSGKAELRKADAAWQRYLTLIGDSGKVDDTLANLMLQAYGAAGLNDPGKAVTAVEYVLDAQPESAGLYSQLALYAWQANQDRKGDLAAAKAVSLTAKDQRATLKSTLDGQKASIKSAASGATGTSDGAVTTTTG
jgi:predicted Zn-dependent protease